MLMVVLADSVAGQVRGAGECAMECNDMRTEVLTMDMCRYAKWAVAVHARVLMGVNLFFSHMATGCNFPIPPIYPLLYASTCHSILRDCY
jgi:hypothetical protein